MEYTREREQLIELQQSRVKANTNRDALREMICAIVHTQTLAFSYSLLRFLLSSFSSRRRVTTITFFFFSVRIYLRTTPLFLSVPNIALFRLSLIRSLRWFLLFRFRFRPVTTTVPFVQFLFFFFSLVFFSLFFSGISGPLLFLHPELRFP